MKPIMGYDFDKTGELSEMGAAWFIAYTYYLCIDRNDERYKNARTWKHRAEIYQSVLRDPMKYGLYLHEMRAMKLPRRKNSLGISPDELAEMQKQI